MQLFLNVKSKKQLMETIKKLKQSWKNTPIQEISVENTPLIEGLDVEDLEMIISTINQLNTLNVEKISDFLINVLKTATWNGDFSVFVKGKNFEKMEDLINSIQDKYPKQIRIKEIIDTEEFKELGPDEVCFELDNDYEIEVGFKAQGFINPNQAMNIFRKYLKNHILEETIEIYPVF